jgi:hypothetical protein
MWHPWERKTHIKFWNETQKEVDNLEEIDVYRRIILNKYDGWLRLKARIIGRVL